MNSTSIPEKKVITKKINQLTLVENGLVLVNKQKEETIVLYSNVEKIYIKKIKFSFFNIIAFYSFLSVLVFIVAFYWPIEMAFFSFFVSIPLAVKFYTYKSYRLYLIHNQGLICFKKFYQKNNKQTYINLVTHVKKEMYYHQTKFPPQLKMEIKANSIIDDYSFCSLNIAYCGNTSENESKRVC